MIKMTPIPVVNRLSTQHKTISPNKHYAAYVADSLFYGKTVNIINLQNKTNFKKVSPDFCYDISLVFKKVKIYQISFNDASNKLYCLVKKDKYTKLYQFDLCNNANLPAYKQWKKHISTFLPFDVQSFAINENDQTINLVGFTGKKIIAKVMQKVSPYELTDEKINNVYSDISKIRLDPNNMQLSVLSQNAELNIFSQNDDGWQLKKTVYDCNEIPSYSKDGNLLVLKNLNKLEIRSILPPHHGKIVYKIQFKYPITDFSINPAGNKIEVFYNYLGTTYYTTIYNEGDISSWFVKKYYSLKVFIGQDYINEYNISDINSMFVNDNNLIVLFDHLRIPYYDLRGLSGTEAIKVVDEEEIARREAKLQRNRTTRSQHSSNNAQNSTRSRRSNNNTAFFPVSASYSCDSGASCSGGFSGC